MRDYWSTVLADGTRTIEVSVVGFLDEGLLVSCVYGSLSSVQVSVVGFLDEGLLDLSRFIKIIPVVVSVVGFLDEGLLGNKETNRT